MSRTGACFGDFLQIMRPQQWYKNLVIVVAVFFSQSLWITNDVLLTMMGFVALCLVSSSGYILNDLIDRKHDIFHPERKDLPIASGRIKAWQAMLISAVSFAASLSLAWWLSSGFLYSLIALFAMTLLYSILLKHYVFIDMIAIATNFVIRALSGVFLISVEVSPWLILCVFFLALFAVAIKRKSDLLLLKRKGSLYKEVLRHYTVEMLDRFININAAIVIMSYCLYSFMRRDAIWVVTVPIVVWGVFRYLYVTERDPLIGRHPERIFLDGGMLLLLGLWCLVTGIILYII